MKTKKEPLNLKYDNNDLYNEEYFKSHTLGLEDKFFIAAGAEKNLPRWKRLDKKKHAFNFDYEAFIKGPNAYFRRGMNTVGNISMLLHIIVFLIFSFRFAALDFGTDAVREYLAAEKPPYSYSEAADREYQYLSPYMEYLGIIYRYENEGVELTPELQEIYDEYNEKINSDEYKTLCGDADRALEYEALQNNAEMSVKPVFRISAVIELLRAVVIVRTVFSLFTDRIYLRKTRNRILEAIAYSDGDDSRAVKKLADADSLRAAQSSFSTKTAVKIAALICFFLLIAVIKLAVEYKIVFP